MLIFVTCAQTWIIQLAFFWTFFLLKENFPCLRKQTSSRLSWNWFFIVGVNDSWATQCQQTNSILPKNKSEILQIEIWVTIHIYNHHSAHTSTLDEYLYNPTVAQQLHPCDQCSLTTRQFAQSYFIFAHFQHSKFNAIYTYPMAVLMLGTLDCWCLHGCAVACA